MGWRALLVSPLEKIARLLVDGLSESAGWAIEQLVSRVVLVAWQFFLIRRLVIPWRRRVGVHEALPGGSANADAKCDLSPPLFRATTINLIIP